MRSHQYLSDIAIADLAFDASGNSPQEMFEATAVALTEAMIDIKEIKPVIGRTLHLSHNDLDQLLFDWLAELIYLKDAETLLFCQFDVKLDAGPPWRLTGKMRGEHIDRKRHTLGMDVKAVTYHLFRVTQSNGLWTARVVVDV